MRKPIQPIVLALCTFAVTTQAQTGLRVEQLSFAAPREVADIDPGRKGQPSRLAWSPDGAQFYVQTLEGLFNEPKDVRHYLVEVQGGARKSVPGPPDWVNAYWTGKSQQASPDAPAVKIDLQTEQHRQQAASVPRGGDLARGGTTVATGTSMEDATLAAYSSQMVTTHTMRLSGETIGQFVNAVIVPGLTFGWGPKGSHVIAYTPPDSGKLVVMNVEGKRQEVPGVKDALLPAWSPDGSHLAWLQKDGRRKYVLMVTEVD